MSLHGVFWNMIIWDYIETMEAYKSAYSVSEFGRTRNYYWQNYVALSGTTSVP